MPQLLSRIDDQGWLTPSIDDILTQGPAPSDDKETIRGQARELQRILTEHDTPVRISNIRLTPSHTYFTAMPGMAGRIGNRRPVTAEEVARNLKHLAAKHPEWRLGLLPEVPGAAGAIGILLRTTGHVPFNLWRLITQNPFREHVSTTTLVIGNSLEQQPVIRDLAVLGNLVIAGDEKTRAEHLRGLLLTLTLFNTPGELRLVLIGSSISSNEIFTRMPHFLGQMVTAPADGRRLFTGLAEEIQRRRRGFQELGVKKYADYNPAARAQDKPLLHRIVVVMDSMADEGWKGNRDRWLSALYDVLINGPAAGIHLIITTARYAEPDTPEVIRNALDTVLILNSVAADALGSLIRKYQGARRFLDAFLVERRKETAITAVESCAVSDDEIERAIAHWRQSAAQPFQKAPITISGELAKLFPAQADAGLTHTNSASSALHTNSSGAETNNAITPDAETLRRAQALASYLGWLGVGPLHDILGLSELEARGILQQLKTGGVIEAGDAPTGRFLRVAPDPSANNGQ